MTSDSKSVSEFTSRFLAPTRHSSVPRLDSATEMAEAGAIKTRIQLALVVGLGLAAAVGLFYWITQWKGPQQESTSSTNRNVVDPRRIPLH